MLFLILSAIILGNILFTNYVNLRQYRKLGEKMPKAASKFHTDEAWKKTTKYNKQKICFNSFTEIAEACLQIVFLYYIEDFHGIFSKRFSRPAVPFLFSHFLINQTFRIPFTAFFDFYIERKYGFNKKTLKVFLIDILLGFLLGACIFVPFLYIAFYLIEKFTNFEIYLGVFIGIFQLFIMWIYPIAIAPLYNTFTPLENESLKKKVEDLALKIGFKLDKIQVMDGSKRSGHSNAYFTGIGKTKKIVFYNTILDQLNENEVIAVLGHELGHWYHNHVVQQMFIGWFEMLGYVVSFKMFIKGASTKFIGISFLEFLIASSAVSVPLFLIVNSIIRSFERQADRFAVKEGHGEMLKDALIKLHTENMSMPIADSLYSALHFSHPHIYERLEFIDNEMKKNE